MSLSQVYITKTAHFLPNEPVSNEEMETYLGYLDGKTSKSKNIVLRNNGIKRRFYALTKEGKTTHTNADLTSFAIKNLFKSDPSALKSIELIACGTTSPDQLFPSHGVMVHGVLKDEVGEAEVVSPAGNCCSGMHALKYAYLSVKSGEVKSAVSTGSERVSKMMRSEKFEDEISKLKELEETPSLAFEKDFLRWMLSDGACAFLLSNKPSDSGLSLRIDWLEGVSYAHEYETCMYMGADKLPDGSIKGYAEFSPEEMVSKSVLAMKQDVRLLNNTIVKLGGRGLIAAMKKHHLGNDEVDHLLPHMSSEYFRNKIAEELESRGVGIPQEKWFSNLTTIGNVGAASIYLMIDELLNSGKLKKGQKILLMVPESARFSYMFGLLTVC
jgi:3-oxoacyl-[acyl-carrier-protein] synthase III